MSSRPKRLQVVFFLGAILAAWVLLKLGLLLARHPERARTPNVATPSLHLNDAGVLDSLAIAPVDRYLASGDRNPFRDPSRDTGLYIRATIRHEFGREVATSRFALDCRMVPEPLGDLRFRLPDGVRVAQLTGDQLDPRRPIGQEGRTLVVPVQPEALHRAHHRCRLALVLESPVSALWRAPGIACTDAMPARCEVGDLAVVVPPGARIDVAPAEASRGLTQLAGQAIPPPLASPPPQFAYHYRSPDYSLAFHVRRLPDKDTAKGKREDREKEKRELADGEEKTDTGERDDTRKDERRRKIDRFIGPDSDFPLKLTMVVQTDGSNPQIQAVLRDRESGVLYRGFPGDLLPNGLKVQRITDDAVILEDSTGRRFIFQGRFATP